MQIFQITGIGIVGAVLLVLVREQKPEIALPLSMVIGITIFLLLIDRIMMVFRIVEQLASRAEIDEFYLQTILRIIGIAYIAEFGSHLCNDAGEELVAKKIELGGKVLIMVMAVPVMVAVIDAILELLP